MKTKEKDTNIPKTLVCQWCGRELKESGFYKCSTEGRKPHICRSCIDSKYTELLTKTDKAKAVLICCHYLDTAFIPEVFASLNYGEDFGIYLRHLNLSQNKDIRDFEQGLINYYDMTISPRDKALDNLKIQLKDISDKLEVIANDI